VKVDLGEAEVLVRQAAKASERGVHVDATATDVFQEPLESRSIHSPDP
jgi:hypothetical protein